MMKKPKIEVGKYYLIEYSHTSGTAYWYEYILNIKDDVYNSRYINKKNIYDITKDFNTSSSSFISSIISAKEISEKEWDKLMLLRVI